MIRHGVNAAKSRGDQPAVSLSGRPQRRSRLAAAIWISNEVRLLHHFDVIA